MTMSSTTGATPRATGKQEPDAPLRLTVSDGMAEILLTRPALLNRFDEELHVAFTRVVRGLATDPKVRSVVLAAEGKTFSAGGDFALMREAYADSAVRRRIVDQGRQLVAALVALPQPLVSALHGAAIGLGATIVLASDAVVAARGATLADTHVLVGLAARDGGCMVWPQSAGRLRARRHLLTGDQLTAEVAYTMGLVTDLVDSPAEVRPAAHALAARIAALPPLAVQSTKRSLNRLTGQRAGGVVDLAFANEEATLASEDLLEGIAAFEERRPPTFTGR